MIIDPVKNKLKYQDKQEVSIQISGFQRISNILPHANYLKSSNIDSSAQDDSFSIASGLEIIHVAQIHRYGYNTRFHLDSKFQSN